MHHRMSLLYQCEGLTFDFTIGPDSATSYDSVYEKAKFCLIRNDL